MPAASITIRSATPDDAAALAALSGELGYPSSPQMLQDRLAYLGRLNDHAVYVAEVSEVGVIGWVHVYTSPLLERDLQAEIGGLVVSAAHRRYGAGRRLMERAEQWALAQKCEAVCLRSNLIREGAHAFYRQIGYQVVKTSLTFRKFLPLAEL